MVGRVGNTVTINGKISAKSPVRAGERVRGPCVADAFWKKAHFPSGPFS